MPSSRTHRSRPPLPGSTLLARLWQRDMQGESRSAPFDRAIRALLDAGALTEGRLRAILARLGSDAPSALRRMEEIATTQHERPRDSDTSHPPARTHLVALPMQGPAPEVAAALQCPQTSARLAQLVRETVVGGTASMIIPHAFSPVALADISIQGLFDTCRIARDHLAAHPRDPLCPEILLHAAQSLAPHDRGIHAQAASSSDDCVRFSFAVLRSSGSVSMTNHAAQEHPGSTQWNRDPYLDMPSGLRIHAPVSWSEAAPRIIRHHVACALDRTARETRLATPRLDVTTTQVALDVLLADTDAPVLAMSVPLALARGQVDATLAAISALVPGPAPRQPGAS